MLAVSRVLRMNALRRATGFNASMNGPARGFQQARALQSSSKSTGAASAAAAAEAFAASAPKTTTTVASSVQGVQQAVAEAGQNAATVANIVYPMRHAKATGWRSPYFWNPAMMLLWAVCVSPGFWLHYWKACDKHAQKDKVAALSEEEQQTALQMRRQGSTVVPTLRDARRSGMKSFKETRWQREDPKEEYVGNRWKQYNNVSEPLTRRNSLNPNARYGARKSERPVLE